MPYGRYARPAGSNRRPDREERKPTMARDGYELIAERSSDRFSDRSELTDEVYEPRLRNPYEDC